MHTFSYTPENLSKLSISKWVTISHVGSILIREPIGRKLRKFDSMWQNYEFPNIFNFQIKFHWIIVFFHYLLIRVKLLKNSEF